MNEMQALSRLEADPTAQVIVLKSVYGKTNHKLKLGPTIDGRTGRMLGVKNLSEEEKRTARYFIDEKTRFELEDGTSFDLSDEIDAIKWECIRHSPYIASSREQAYSGDDTVFFVQDENKEVNKQLTRANSVFEAMEYVRERSQAEWFQVARLLGSNMEASRPNEVMVYLNSVAMDTPGRILSVKRDPHFKSKLFLLGLLDKNILQRQSGMIKYGELTLGVDEDQALLWLKDSRNRDVVDLLHNKLYPEFARPQNEETAFDEPVTDDSDQDAEPSADFSSSPEPRPARRAYGRK